MADRTNQTTSSSLSVDTSPSNESLTSVMWTTTLHLLTSSASNFTNSSARDVIPNITILTRPFCTEPAYLEFPPDAFTNEQRAHGGFILHFIMVIYMFIALAIVCDDYFVTSLDKISAKLGLSEDVAGATFMAAGSSAPELCTAIIGVFITKGDVGVGTIVGSAVFNILCVIGLCGILAGEVVTLSWWSFTRDAVYYSFSVLVLILVVQDGKVTWYESLLMLIFYGGYILVMRFDVPIQSWVCKKIDRILTSNILPVNGVKTFSKDYEVFEDDDDVFISMDHKPPKISEPDMPADEYARSTKIKPKFCDFIFRLMMMKRFRPKTRFRSAAFLIISYRRGMLMDTHLQKRQQFRKMAQKSSVLSYTRSIRGWFNMTMEGENLDGWKTVPKIDEGVLKLIGWGSLYPIRFILYYTVPDCRKERWENWFMATFVCSVLWIVIFSYIMVWMVTLIGYTLDIPDSVMGITFLAAGTSIPDAMASVFVARQGMGDMAVSNSLGSNVFDILLGLSLPWFLKTGIAYAGTTVHINSNGMVFSILLLFLTVVILVVALKYTRWRLNRRVGALCLLVYAVYILFSVMIECNVFGFVNPPMCD
ncbi:sodium/potassium/calcium exchanger 4-like [Saccostrea echinata]|uniref:sodium/potassium/calcium exchanger 4-like n=1 Tax=Saccostrea echinata TaxID=191078 RepID=UPI002A81E0E6|nr:sodium/potassium/calcium exchanger 4-like [Saccostrea echinata]